MHYGNSWNQHSSQPPVMSPRPPLEYDFTAYGDKSKQNLPIAFYLANYGKNIVFKGFQKEEIPA